MSEQLPYHYFQSWSEVYRSDQATFIWPTNTNAASILLRALSHKPNTRWPAITNNPGLGTFVSVDHGSENRHLEIIHHFFQLEKTDMTSAAAQAFIGLEHQHKTATVPKDVYNMPTSKNKVETPDLNTLLNTSTRDQLLTLTPASLDKNSEAARLFFFTAITPKMISIIEQNNQTPVDCFLAIRDHIIEDFCDNTIDPTAAAPFQPILQALWAAAHNAPNYPHFNDQWITRTDDPDILAAVVAETLLLFDTTIRTSDESSESSSSSPPVREVRVDSPADPTTTLEPYRLGMLDDASVELAPTTIIARQPVTQQRQESTTVPQTITQQTQETTRDQNSLNTDDRLNELLPPQVPIIRACHLALPTGPPPMHVQRSPPAPPPAVRVAAPPLVRIPGRAPAQHRHRASAPSIISATSIADSSAVSIARRQPPVTNPVDSQLKSPAATPTAAPDTIMDQQRFQDTDGNEYVRVARAPAAAFYETAAPPAEAKEKSNALTTCMPCIRNMIFWASTPQGQDMVPDANPDFVAFLNSPKDCALTFLDKFAIKEGWDWHIDYRIMKGLRALDLTVQLNDVSEVYSIFLCGQKERSLAHKRMSAYEIEESKNIKHRREAMVNENLKIKYTVPVDCDLLLIQLKNFRGLTAFLFSEKSPILACIDPWIKLYDRQRIVLRDRCERDPSTCAKILTLVDSAVQDFLFSCESATVQAHIDYDGLCPKEYMRQVLKNHALTIRLPDKLADILESKLAAVSKQRSITLTFDNSGSREAPVKVSAPLARPPSSKAWDDNPKKRKFDNKKTTNTTCDAELQQMYKKHKKTLDKQLNNMPQVNSTTMCGKYHLEGLCTFGSTCKRAESHVALSKRQQDDLKAWIDGAIVP